MEMSTLKEKLSSTKQTQTPAHKADRVISTAALEQPLCTVSETNYLALSNNALEIIGENLKNQPMSYQLFDVIKSPSGGSTSFTVPTISGEEIKKELNGIILSYSTPRAYWDSSDPIEGTPPNCWSSDSIVSHDGKPCNRCTFNEFGSKDNGNGTESNGKACKESVSIVLLRPDNIMPIIVRVPVSSKLMFQKFIMRLVGNMIPYYGVEAKITLNKATNKTGQPYAVYNFEAVNTLSPDEIAYAQAYGKKFVEILDSVEDEHKIADVA